MNQLLTDLFTPPSSINLHSVEVPPAASHLDILRRRDSSPPGLGNSTIIGWVEVREADKHRENSKTNHNSLRPGHSVSALPPNPPPCPPSSLAITRIAGINPSMAMTKPATRDLFHKSLASCTGKIL